MFQQNLLRTRPNIVIIKYNIFITPRTAHTRISSLRTAITNKGLRARIRIDTGRRQRLASRRRPIYKSVTRGPSKLINSTIRRSRGVQRLVPLSATLNGRTRFTARNSWTRPRWYFKADLRKTATTHSPYFQYGNLYEPLPVASTDHEYRVKLRAELWSSLFSCDSPSTLNRTLSSFCRRGQIKHAATTTLHIKW